MDRNRNDGIFGSIPSRENIEFLILAIKCLTSITISKLPVRHVLKAGCHRATLPPIADEFVLKALSYHEKIAGKLLQTFTYPTKDLQTVTCKKLLLTFWTLPTQRLRQALDSRTHRYQKY